MNQPEPASSSSPTPTQKSFTPVERAQTRNGILLGLTCLAIFALGVGMWLLGEDVFSFLGASSTRDWLNVVGIKILSPLMLPAAVYCFYSTWRDWRLSRRFEQNKQHTTAVVTHLWVGRDTDRRKTRYVGYQFNGDQTAYQEIPLRVYNALAVGDSVEIDYLPGETPLSHMLEPKKSRARKKQPADAA
jgi:hypothetical protein